MSMASERSSDVEKKRCLERSTQQAAQEAGVTKATAACSTPRHLKQARCPSPGAREAGQEAQLGPEKGPALKEALSSGPEKGCWSVALPTPLPQGS